MTIYLDTEQMMELRADFYMSVFGIGLCDEEGNDLTNGDEELAFEEFREKYDIEFLDEADEEFDEKYDALASCCVETYTLPDDDYDHKPE